MMNEPRTVIVTDFDYLNMGISIDNVARAIRKDICKIYNMSQGFAEYTSIALSKLEMLISNPDYYFLTE